MEATTNKSKKRALWAFASLLLTPLVLALHDRLLALWPAAVALGLVFVTKKAPLALGSACLSALLLILLTDRNSFFEWLSPTGGFLATLTSPWHFYALIFTLLLGSLSAVIEASGGLLALLHAGGEITEKTRRRFLNSVLEGSACKC